GNSEGSVSRVTRRESDTVTRRGKPWVRTAKNGALGSPPRALSTMTLLPSPPFSWAMPARRENATRGSCQPRQRMRPSSHSGASAIGSGSANDSTSAMVALGNNNRAPAIWISTPRISAWAVMFMASCSQTQGKPARGQALGEVGGRHGLSARGDQRRRGGAVETVFQRLSGDEGALARRRHDLRDHGRVAAAEQQDRTVARGQAGKHRDRRIGGAEHRRFALRP